MLLPNAFTHFTLPDTLGFGGDVGLCKSATLTKNLPFHSTPGQAAPERASAFVAGGVAGGGQVVFAKGKSFCYNVINYTPVGKATQIAIVNEYIRL